MSAEVILKLDAVEIRSRDALTIRTVLDMLGTALSPTDRRDLSGDWPDRTSDTH